MRKRFTLGLGLALLFVVLAVVLHPVLAAKKHTVLLISAAASLQDSLNAIKTNYEKEHPNIKLTFNYGSSGTLQKQLEQGAPADIFFSAGKKQMNALIKEKVISDSKNILNNDLVLVVPSDSKQALNEVNQLTDKSIAKVAIGQPETVPAGQYAKETLTALNMWDSLQNKLVYAKDVRQVLNDVETDNADAGFVYRTDALTSSKVKIALSIDPGEHTPIVYPAGVVSASKHGTEAKAFFTYLQSSEAGSVFKKYGFTLQ